MCTFADKTKVTQQTKSPKATVPAWSCLGHNHEVNSILHLQRTIGNQAVQRLLQSNAEEGNTKLPGKALPHLGHDFARIPVYPSKVGSLQTKLAINKPGDVYEQEADRVAEQVMRMEQPAAVSPAAEILQRKCSVCEDEANAVSRSLSDGKKPRIQGLANCQGGGEVASDFTSRLGAGAPLYAASRSFFEPRFGHGFSRVRVHTDARSAESAREVDALSYTVGEHIVFAPGQYAPRTHAGDRLLAHELTHTIQDVASPGVLRRQLTGGKKQEAPHKHDKPDWIVQPTQRPNEFELYFSDFTFEYEVLSAVFKAGKLPPGFKLAGGGGGSVNTRWTVTVPADLSAASASALLDPRFANRIAAETKKKDQAARLAAEQRIGREQLPEFTSRTYQGNLSMGEVGLFHAEYDPMQGTLTISVPIQFNFKDSDSEKIRIEGDPRGTKPVTLVNEKEYKRWNDKEIENWRTKFIKVVQETWSSEHTQHTIYCHKPGWEILQAKVVVKVDQIGATTSGRYFEATVYRGDAPEGSCGQGQPAMMECVRKGFATFAYNDVAGDMNVAAHEFGHMLGLGDEYDNPSKPGAQAAHSGMVFQEFGYGVPRLDSTRKDQFRESIMSSGGKVLPEHGVVFLEAMRRITGIDEWHLRPRSP
jgi:hypothetical protein